MENNYLKLADIPTGEECVIVKVHGHGSFRNRIVEMGFVRGEKVTVIKNAPLHDPIEYKLMDGHISLRRSEARLIEVVCTSSIDQEGYNGTFTEDEIARESGNVAQYRNDADALILEVWNEVERYFEGVKDEEEKRYMCEEYGLVYVFRRGEKERIRRRKEAESITLKLF